MWSSLLPEVDHDGDDHDNCGGGDVDDGGHDNCGNNGNDGYTGDGDDELTRQSLISPGNVRTWRCCGRLKSCDLPVG